MRSKMLGLAITAAAIMAFATPSFAARAKMTREAAIEKCNGMVKQNRGGGMADDMTRSAGWKACMNKLGFRP